MSSADHAKPPQPAGEDALGEVGPPAFVFSDDDDETGLTPAHPAATVVVFHEPEAGAAPKILMVRRSQKMKFAAGAAVFPGGRVDADDHVLAERYADGIADRLDGAARVAAIRETLEETGLGIGIVHHKIADTLAIIRDGLMADRPFSQLLDAHDAKLDVGALLPFARWRPNFNHARVFDTRFYLTLASNDVPDLTVHQSENSEVFWAGAADILVRADRGELDVIFPTKRNLERIAQFASFADAAESARNIAVRRITPWIESRDGGAHLCIRNDCGYPVTSESVDAAMRG